PYHPFDLVASPDGTRVYLANQAEGLSYIETAGYSFVGPVIEEADKLYLRLEVSPDSAYIFAVTVNVRNWQSGLTIIDAVDFSIVGTLDITGPYQWLSFNGIDIHPTRDELYLIYSDTAGLGLPDFYVIDISDPAAPAVSSTLTTGTHDDIYGELLIIRP
ncbi:MAG TPA: hypothetical protein PLM29_12990, partial [Deltaproteobacteria bacterium]|nr:hypothetical protein [Deltaproteobacteria bacterium]